MTTETLEQYVRKVLLYAYTQGTNDQPLHIEGWFEDNPIPRYICQEKEAHKHLVEDTVVISKRQHVRDEKLAACPFCGSKDLWWGDEEGKFYSNAVFCEGCDTGFVFHWHGGYDKYLQQWNDRKVSDEV